MILFVIFHATFSTSHNPTGLDSLLQEQRYVFCVVFIVCNVSFIVCVVLCAVFSLSMLCHFV
jgi:hypothetical protein